MTAKKSLPVVEDGPANPVLGYLRSMTLFWVLLFPIILWSLAWYLLKFHQLLPAADGLAASTTDFSIIISLFFYQYLLNSWHYYTEGPKQYRQILDDLDILSNMLFATIHNGPDAKDISSRSKVGHHIRHMIKRLAFNITVILMPHQQTPERVIIDGEHEPKDKIEACFFLIRHMVWNVRILEERKFMRTADVNIFMQNLDRINVDVKNLDVSQSVGDLEPINWHITIVILFYFLFVIPFKMVSAVDWLIFLFYPIIIYALIGVILIRKYIGSPFRRAMRWHDTRPQKWYAEFVTKIDTHHASLENRKPGEHCELRFVDKEEWKSVRRENRTKGIGGKKSMQAGYTAEDKGYSQWKGDASHRAAMIANAVEVAAVY